MDYQEWLPLFGLAATDPRVVNALAAQGVTAPVTLPPQTLVTGVDLKTAGLSVSFMSEFKLRGGVADLPILIAVVMTTVPGKSAPKGSKPYAGPLPHGLSKKDGRDEVVAKLGEPVVLDDYFNSGRWVVDGHHVSILFTDDWKAIRQLGVTMHGAI